MKIGLTQSHTIKIIYSINEEKVYKGVNPFSAIGIERFKKYCQQNGIYYYGRPKEAFNMHEAIEEALKTKCQTLYLENLL